MARETVIVRNRRVDGASAVVCGRCVIADTFATRLRGLLGHAALARDEGLLIRPASSVHTFFMRFTIDAVFLDRDDVVVKIVRGLRPWRVAWARGASRTLELRAGAAAEAGLARGDRLWFGSAPPTAVAA